MPNSKIKWIFQNLNSLGLDKGDFTWYIVFNRIIRKKNAMNSHITKSNRVLIDAFCDMCFFMNVILFNLINGGHLHDTRYSKMV